MGIRTVGFFFFASSLFTAFIQSSTVSSDQPRNVQVIVESNERVSSTEVHFQVKVTNLSERPVFLIGIIYENESRLYPLYLEQNRRPGGWKLVVPCVDMQPPHIIKLEPTSTTRQDLVLTVPIGGVCKVQNINLGGKFRFRLNYFGTEERARAHLEKFGSWGWENAHEGEAISEAFEIPPYRPPGQVAGP